MGVGESGCRRSKTEHDPAWRLLTCQHVRQTCWSMIRVDGAVRCHHSDRVRRSSHTLDKVGANVKLKQYGYGLQAPSEAYVIWGGGAKVSM